MYIDNNDDNKCITSDKITMRMSCAEDFIIRKKHMIREGHMPRKQI